MDLITITASLFALIAAIIAVRLVPRKVTIRESNVGVLYRNGRLHRILQPGAYWLQRWGREWTVIDVRQRSVTVPGQEVLTADSIGLKVSAAIRFSVSDAEKALHKVEDYSDSVYLLVQLALRSVIGSLSVEELLEKRVEIGAQILYLVKPEAETFGLTVQAAEVKDVMFSGELKRVFAEVVKAEKEGQAALARARGESAALRNLANAAQLLEKNPGLFQLRFLETIDAAGKGVGNTLVVGMPEDLVKNFGSKA